MNLLSKDFDLSFLSSRFENIFFQLFVSNDENSYISCIACWCEKSSQVTENWSAIQNYMSVYYQPPGDLAVWNIYLAFFCVESLTQWEKYVIENDKYAVRKLVLDGIQASPNSAHAQTLINNHLLGADLELKESNMQPKLDFSLFLNDYVRGTPLDTKVASREERAQRINNIIGFLDRHETKES